MNGTIGRCAEAPGAIGGGAVAATAGIQGTRFAPDRRGTSITSLRVLRNDVRRWPARPAAGQTTRVHPGSAQ
jgi:hypothetical protein